MFCRFYYDKLIFIYHKNISITVCFSVISLNGRQIEMAVQFFCDLTLIRVNSIQYAIWTKLHCECQCKIN